MSYLGDDLERARFVAKGPDAYFCESAELALHMIRHSETPDLYTSTADFATPGRMRMIGKLTFSLNAVDELYDIVIEYYDTCRPSRGVTMDALRDLMQRHRRYVGQDGGRLVVSDVDNLTEMIATCLP